ncbi:MAG: M12 family metallopeptidase, partial [Bryobacterales bacterium]|nr:M12 family metallopeptidase [Bryobacterales bacterium]
MSRWNRLLMVRVAAWLACAGTLFCVLKTATPAQGQFPSTGYQATGSGEAEGYGAVRRTGVALHRGQALRYEVINGMAVHDGDIVLGTVEEVLAGNSRSLASKDATGSWPVRRDISAVEDEFLWPGGVVPYVIDPGFTAETSGAIQAAVDEWNSRTVIALVERTTESEFVRFRAAEDGPCRAGAGRRVGRETGIWLPDSCSVGTVIHEIGHAVGLWHEHQRVDRDQYIVVSDRHTYGFLDSAYIAFAPAGGPYDYASIMHYGGIQTIPPGMPVRGERLSAGDIDGVARLYGMAPAVTTIATNPPGMEIRVDGERMATPATFDWSPGSRHVVEALSSQTVGGRRLVFGRWNDEASRRRTVTAGPDRTWFEANYIVQPRLVACADPAEAGEVRVRPEMGDGYRGAGTPVEIEAVPGGRHAFLRWDGSRLSRPADRGSRWNLGGESSNPATGSISPWVSRRIEVAAQFAAEPLFRIDSSLDGIGILVNGETRRLPWAFPAGAYPDGVTVEAPAVIPEETRSGDDVRYRFGNWSDGGDRIHRVTVPATGGSVSLNMTHEYRLRVGARHHEDETAISISPASADGFYPAGTQAVLTALPPRGQRFAGWTGEASGPGTVLTVVMDAAKSIEGVFARNELLLPDEEEDVVLDAASRFTLYSHGQGWHVLAPRDAAEMTVRFQASSAAEVDLYVRRGSAVWSESADDGEAPRIHADFESTAPGANEAITIRRGSAPPLTNDVYYVALGAQPTGRPIRGTLSVEIRRSGIVGAWPRAFTFGAPWGSDPGSQAMQLTHETASPVRYRIDSNQQWLSASPQEWVQTGPGTTEIAVMVNTAGLAHGTHHGDLTVVQVADESAQAEAKTTGIEIPVALAVVPTNLSSSVSRRVNGVQIRSRPAEGDTYGAGEEIEVGVGLVEPAEVTGSPTLALRVGSQVRQVEWASQGLTGFCGEGYTTLIFRYIVQADDRDVDGIDILGNALTLNGGSIADSDGTPAVLATAPLANAGDHRVDGSKVTPPAVSWLRILSRPQDGEAYGAGEEIRVQLGFSQPVEATGTPRLALGVGGQT